MKVVLQRVSSASVTVTGEAIANIGKGVVALLGIAKDDTQRDVDIIVDKIKHLRLFQDENGKMNHSIQDIGAELLVVSQFTLLANLTSGRRPSLSDAAPPAVAEKLYRDVIALLKNSKLQVREGRFKEYMALALVNDGPVTFIIDTKEHNR